MTSHEETLLTETLDRHAAQAPTDTDLLGQIHTRLRRRRKVRGIGAVVLACAAVATSLTAGTSLIRAMTSDNNPPAAAQAGWRWESYSTVQVQVPASWKTYVSGPAPCTDPAPIPAPAIGRMDQWTDRNETPCKVAVLPVTQRHEYLWFNDVQQPGTKHYDGGWTEETRLVSGVKLSVLTKDDSLRSQILDSARPITGEDHYGCKPSDRPATDRTKRPAPGGDPTKVGTVESVDICEYWTGPLIASSRVTGPRASALVMTMTSAPKGNSPGLNMDCVDSVETPGHGYGITRDRFYQLTVRGSTGSWRGRLVYTPCYLGDDSYPYDDGVTTWVLPLSAIKIIRSGVHSPFHDDSFILTHNTTPAAR